MMWGTQEHSFEVNKWGRILEEVVAGMVEEAQVDLVCNEVVHEVSSLVPDMMVVGNWLLKKIQAALKLL